MSKNNPIHGSQKNLILNENNLHISQNSQEYLNFIFERNESLIKPFKHKKSSFRTNQVIPVSNTNMEILSSHTEPDTEMFFHFN